MTNPALQSQYSWGDHPILVVARSESALIEMTKSLGSIACAVISLASVDEAMTQADLLARASCLIVEADGPLDVLLLFERRRDEVDRLPPVIFTSSSADVRMTILAMKAGAVDVLPQPIIKEDLAKAVLSAAKTSETRRCLREERRITEEAAASLTTRQHEILRMIAGGLLNKEIAYHLGLSEITVKLHRGAMMRRLNVRTPADLLRKAFAFEHYEIHPQTVSPSRTPDIQQPMLRISA